MTIQILIVEDENIIGMDLKATLQKIGYSVLAIVSSAEKAFSILQKQRPDLILMDIHLKTSMNGITAAAEVRKSWGIPVVFLTAHSDAATLTKAYETRPFGYVTKPFHQRDLQIAIEIACSRHEAEKNLQMAVTKERELGELKSRLLATVIHDIRNPLAVIGLGVDLLEMSISDSISSHQEKRLRKIRDANQFIQQLLNEVLELKHLESEKLAFRPESIDLVQWCIEFIEEIQLLTSNQISFSWQGTETLVFMDAILLQRIFSNLLSNAIKYSPPDSPIEFHLNLTSDLAIFLVSDRGIGIPLEMQERLFEPFQRAVNVGKIVGMGLGLSIVKTCIDLCQGDIQMQSTSDQGTQVTVSLPIFTMSL